MLPYLRPDHLVVGWRRTRNLKPGSVVIIRHNGLEKVKRVREVTSTSVFVVGDNAEESTDSRQFGWISRDLVLAKVIWPRERSHSTDKTAVLH